MNKHTELIERLRCFDRVTCNEAADALEAQAREIASMQQQESELCTLHAMAEAECKRLRAEVEGLNAARVAYASEFPPDGDGHPDVGSIHQNIRAMKKESDTLRKDAERYRWLRHGDNDEKVLCNGPVAKDYWYLLRNEKLDAAIDAANGAA